MPVSAVAGDQVDLLAQLLVGLMPEGPALYPDGDLTDAPEEVLAAELIREAALDGVHDELPHSIAVVVEEMGLREGRPDDKPLLDIYANLYVERDSQKGIVIGKKGVRLRQVGTVARKQIESLLGTPVYLDLHVKVAKDWQRDPRQLRKLGFSRKPSNRPQRRDSAWSRTGVRLRIVVWISGSVTSMRRPRWPSPSVRFPRVGNKGWTGCCSCSTGPICTPRTRRPGRARCR